MAENERSRSRYHTVPVATVAVLIDVLESIGGNVDLALTKASIPDVRHFSEEDSAGVVPRPAFAKFAQECFLAFHYHSCRRDSLQPFPVNNFRLMCIAMLACPDLRIAIETAQDFQRAILSDHSRIILECEAGRAKLLLNTMIKSKETSDLILTIHSISVYSRLFGWMIGEEIPIIRAEVNFPHEYLDSNINDLFDIHPIFGSEYSLFEFSDYYLYKPVTRKFQELSQLFRLFPFDLHPPDDQSQRLDARVLAATRRAIALGNKPPEMTEFAEMFGVTAATFRRRLASESTSLTVVRNECRRELAVQFLASTDLSVKEIAARLQFCDAATFRRAFHLWIGMSPSHFRAKARRFG